MEWKPNIDYLLVKETSGETKSEGGIILPEGIGNTNTGEVIATGPGLYSAQGTLIPMNIPVGSIVVYEPHSGKVIKLEGVEYKLVRESEVMTYNPNGKVVSEKVQLNG